jgi:hypothetical protein
MSKTVTGIVMAAVGAVSVFIAVMLAIFVYSARDDYGRLEIPGKAVIHFPADKIHVTYEEHVSNRDLAPPGDLRVAIQPVDGGPPIDYTPKGGHSNSNTTHSSRVALSAFQIPAEGDYVVTATAPSAGPGPDLQFGRGFFYALFHGVPLYILIGAAFLFVGGAFVSTRPEDEWPAMPAS